jgi:hypothetical protein
MMIDDDWWLMSIEMLKLTMIDDDWW